MKRAFVVSSLILLAVLPLGACRTADTARPETQSDFGVRMARMNLWREAMFRFRRAVDLQPDDALAHNNLAVAYEANGDFDKAAEEYRLAIRLDRSNQHIQKNYSRFVEFTSRNRKRQASGRTTETEAASPTTGAASSPAPVTATGSKTPAPPSSTPPAGPTSAAPAAIPSPAPAPPVTTSNPPTGAR